MSATSSAGRRAKIDRCRRPDRQRCEPLCRAARGRPGSASRRFAEPDDRHRRPVAIALACREHPFQFLEVDVDMGDRWLDEIAASAAPSHSRIWDSYPKVRFAPDSPQEGGVSCELVSENAKFPASRENTGNFIDSGLGGASEAAKKGMKSVSYGPIPYAS